MSNGDRAPRASARYARGRMTRPKTISDEDLLAVARRLFRAHGHAVSTRQVAESAGISEAILYQRFGNKDELFFAAMAPGAPDLEKVLGPEPPTLGPREYLATTGARLAEYIGEVLPLGLRVIAHPSFDHRSLGHAQVGLKRLHEGLVRRLKWFEGERRLRRSTAETLGQIMINLAHDWALHQVMSSRSSTPSERAAAFGEMVDLVWKGAAPPRR
jgi:AcrR family transcriptional regulator